MRRPQVPSTRSSVQPCLDEYGQRPHTARGRTKGSKRPTSATIMQCKQAHNKDTARRMSQTHGAAHDQTRARGKWSAIRTDTENGEPSCVCSPELGHKAGLHDARRSCQASTSTMMVMLSKILRFSCDRKQRDVNIEGRSPPQCSEQRQRDCIAGFEEKWAHLRFQGKAQHSGMLVII